LHDFTLFQQKLHTLLEAGWHEAAYQGRPVLVSLTVEIAPVQPLTIFNRAPAEERVLWEQPDQGFSMVAIGVEKHCTGYAEGRFAQVAAYHQFVSQAVLDTVHSYPLSAPVVLGGFAFDPVHQPHLAWEDYPDALLVLPRFLFVCYANASWLTINLIATTPGAVTDTADRVVRGLQALLSQEQSAIKETPAEVIWQEDAQAGAWKEKVTKAIADIQRGTVEKLVLAREIYLRSRQPFPIGTILHRLRASYSSCTLFAFARGKSCFLGATPECLIRLTGQKVQVNCLAGSMSRGASDAEDQLLGESLLANPKERHEHALVVRGLREALEPFCSYLNIPDMPQLLRLPNVQHLSTSIEGILKKEGHILDLVERLHPTPSLGGLPRAAALSLIRQYEPYSRGWYAAPLGWIDGRGHGEFVVAIRSALFRDREAWLYAGCGIVSGSDAAQEYAESCLKLQPMLSALQSKEL
jgi:isochorismate synthase